MARPSRGKGTASKGKGGKATSRSKPGSKARAPRAVTKGKATAARGPTKATAARGPIKAPAKAKGTTKKAPPTIGARKGPRWQATSSGRVFHEFHQIIDAIYESMDAAEIGRRVLGSALNLLGCDLGLIGELNHQGNFDALAMVGTVWKPGHAQQGGAMDDADFFKDLPIRGLMTKVVADGVPVIMNEVQPVVLKSLEDRYDRMVPIDNVLAVPFRVMGRVMGMIAVGNKEGGFSEEDRDTLMELANLVSMARSKMMALSAAIRSSRDGIVLVDRNGVLSMVNPAMERMFSYTSDEIEGRSFLGLFLEPGTGAPLGEPIAGAVIEGSWNGEAIGLKRDGTRFPVDLSVVSIDEESSPRTGFMAVVRDVSTEKQVKGMAELYLETAEVMLMAMDLECKITMINRKGEAVLGMSRKDLIGKDWIMTCVAPKDKADTRRFLEHHIEKGIRYPVPDINDPSSTGQDEPPAIDSLTYKIRSSNGEERILHCRHSYLRDPQGSVTGILTSGNDITERTKAEKAMRESEELYRILVKTSPEAIVVTDLKGIITEVSDLALELYGADDPGEMIGRNSFDFIVEEDRRNALELMNRTVEDGIVKNIEHHLIRKGGGTYLCSMNAALVRDAEGNPKAFIAAMVDITESRQASEKLREAEEMYRTLFENAPAGIVRIDPATGRIVMANDRAGRRLGYKDAKDFVENGKATDLMSTDNIKFLVDKIRKEGIVHDLETETMTADGRRIFVIVNAFYNPKNGYIDFAGQEVTPQKEAEERARNAEGRYRALFMMSPAGIIRIGLGTRKIVMANERIARALGYDNADDMVKNCDTMQLYSDKDREAVLGRLMTFGYVDEYELQLTRKDGSKMWAVINARVDREEGVADFTGIDITRWKETERQLKEAEESYRRMFSASSAGMVRIQLHDGKAQYANEAFARMLGYSSVDHVKRVFKVQNHLKDSKRWNDLLDQFGGVRRGPMSGGTSSLLVGFVPNTEMEIIKLNAPTIKAIISGCIYIETGLADLTFIDTSLMKNKK